MHLVMPKTCCCVYSFDERYTIDMFAEVHLYNQNVYGHDKWFGTSFKTRWFSQKD